MLRGYGLKDVAEGDGDGRGGAWINRGEGHSARSTVVEGVAWVSDSEGR